MADDLLNNTVDYTLERRRQVIEHLEKQKDMNFNDPKMAKIYLSALDGMDRAVIGQSRAKTEERAADNDAEVAKVAAEMVKQLGSRNPFESQTPTQARPEPKLSEEVTKNIKVQDHVLEQGVSKETIDEFNNRVGNR